MTAGLVYHLVPDHMTGSKLWPLSSLAEVAPIVHASYARRYDDRPGLMDRPVEPLGCAWSDCVFLCPVDPRVLVESARAARPDLPARDWFSIDVETLDTERVVLFEPYRWDRSVGPPPITDRDCRPFTQDALDASSVVSDATRTRLSDPRNRLPLFVDVVHVLHRGPISVEYARIVRI